MFFLPSLVLAIFLTTSSILAMPHPFASQLSPARLQPVACPGHRIKVCKDVHWQDCTDIYNCNGGGPGLCNQLDGQASAIGPQEGVHCNFYKNAYCDDLEGPPLTLRYPGVDWLGDDWNDNIFSYQCFSD